MHKILSRISETPYRLMAAIAGIAAISPGSAHAQASSSAPGTFGAAADAVNTSFGSMGQMVLGGSMVAGLGLSGAGLLKLKAAADSGGQQVKYSEGLWRVGVGAGLVALPTIITTTLATGAMNGGGSINEGTVKFN